MKQQNTEFYKSKAYAIDNFTTATLEHLRLLQPTNQVISGLCAANVKFVLAALTKEGINILSHGKAKDVPVTIHAGYKSDDLFSVTASLSISLKNYMRVDLPKDFTKQTQRSFIFYHISSVELYDVASDETIYEKFYSLYDMESECWIKDADNPEYTRTFPYFLKNKMGNPKLDHWGS